MTEVSCGRNMSQICLKGVIEASSLPDMES